jgi:hypothetical protein
MEEYKQLRQAMAALTLRMETLGQRTLLVAAAVFSWVAVQGVGTTAGHEWCARLPTELSSVIWFLPFGYAAFAGVAALAAYWRLARMERYIQSLESTLGAEDLGWETGFSRTPRLIGPVALIYWLVLLIGTLLAGMRGASFVSSIGSAC